MSSVLRATCVALAAVPGSAAAIGLLAWATRGALAEAREGMSLDTVLGLAAAGGAWAALCWLSAGFTIAVVAALPGAASSRWERLAGRVAPAGARRLARIVVGTVIATGGILVAALPASADAVSPTTAREPVAPAPEPLPDLDRPIAGSDRSASAAAPATPAGTPAATSTARSTPAGAPSAPSASTAVPDGPDRSAVTVVAGDTLWDIAADRLGPDVTASEIAAEWPRWYAENKAVIGADPDLIFPGQRLLPPTS